MKKIINTSDKDFDSQFSELLNIDRNISENVEEVVRSIVQNVKSKGNDEESGLLSEAEKEELMITLQDTVNEIQKETDKVNDIKNRTNVS